jgi:hypothetical protein
VGAETANTTATIYRGSTSNQFGDQVDSNVPLMTGIPVTLVETGKNVQDPSTPTPRTIRQIYCNVPQWTGVTLSDRLMDESTGDIYIIIGIKTPPTTIGAPVDTVLDLRRVSAQTA